MQAKSIFCALGVLILCSQSAFPDPEIDPFFALPPEFYEGLAPLAVDGRVESESSPNLFRQIGSISRTSLRRRKIS